ncbi:MAG: hypothetical protein ABIU05_03930 [Nitrospirales bacterium]
MFNCPRCAGCTRLVDVITEEEPITVLSCMNCGHGGGEATIDHHHSLDTPPEPFRELSQPIYEPTHRKLSYQRIPGAENVGSVGGSLQR